MLLVYIVRIGVEPPFFIRCILLYLSIQKIKFKNIDKVREEKSNYVNMKSYLCQDATAVMNIYTAHKFILCTLVKRFHTKV